MNVPLKRYGIFPATTPEACESTIYPTLSAQFDLSGDHPLYEKFLKLMEEGKRNA